MFRAVVGRTRTKRRERLGRLCLQKRVRENGQSIGEWYDTGLETTQPDAQQQLCQTKYAVGITDGRIGEKDLVCICTRGGGGVKGEEKVEVRGRRRWSGGVEWWSCWW